MCVCESYFRSQRSPVSTSSSFSSHLARLANFLSSLPLLKRFVRPSSSAAAVGIASAGTTTTAGAAVAAARAGGGASCPFSTPAPSDVDVGMGSVSRWRGRRRGRRRVHGEGEDAVFESVDAGSMSSDSGRCGRVLGAGASSAPPPSAAPSPSAPPCVSSAHSDASCDVSMAVRSEEEGILPGAMRSVMAAGRNEEQDIEAGGGATVKGWQKGAQSGVGGGSHCEGDRVSEGSRKQAPEESVSDRLNTAAVGGDLSPV